MAEAVGTEPLIERDLELAAVEAFLDRVRGGRGGRLLIEGPAGIGKSAVLDATGERARVAGMTSLSAQVPEVGARVAFQIVRDVLGPVWWRGTGGEDVLQRGVRAVLDLAEQQPVLLSVDDVQWADRASLRWLTLLAQRASAARVAIAMAVRTGEPGDAPDVLSQLLDDRSAIVVRPAALSPDAAAALLSARLGAVDPELVACCHEETGGNPFLLHAVSDALAQDGVPAPTQARERLRELAPRAVGRSVAGRLDRLDADARRLIEALAVIGDIGDTADLAVVSDVDPNHAADALLRLAEVNLVRSATRPAPAPPLVGAAVLAQVPAGRRELLARRAVDRLRAAGRTDEAAARLVELPARGDPDVVDTLAAAAALAGGRGAADVAAGLLQRALAEPPPAARGPELRAALGTTLVSVGNPDAIAVLTQALQETAAGPKSAELAAQLATALHFARRTDDAVAVLDEASARLAAEHVEAAEELEALALHYLSFDPAHRTRRQQRLATLGDRRGESELAYRMRLAGLSSDSLNAARPAQDTVRLAERALAGGTLLSRDYFSFLAAVLTLAYAGRPAAARVHLQDLLAVARTSGDAVRLGFAFGVHGEIRRVEGAMVATEVDIRTGADLLPAGELGPRFMLRGLIESLVEQQRITEAEQVLRDGELTGELPELMPTPGLLVARARVHLAAGSMTLGLETLLGAGEIAERLGLRDPVSVPWRIAAAEVLHAVGERRQAADHVAAHLELAARTGLPEAIGAALRVQGLLEGGSPGRATLARAVELLDGGFARLELARALVDLGAAEPNPADARGHLQRGAELAEELGAEAVRMHAEDLLAAGGARPRRRARRGTEALTPAERRIARLAAEGMTNREIAETLVVSEKTVESHLAAVFRKVGIRSRTQLPQVLDAKQAGAAAEA